MKRFAIALALFVLLTPAVSLAADPPPPCAGEDDAWRCFDTAPTHLAELLVTLEFECYDVLHRDVAPLVIDPVSGWVTRYRVTVRQIDGCTPPDTKG